MADVPSSFAADLWTSLETIATVRRYEPESALFEQGQSASGIYMIQKGQVQVWMPDGLAQTIITTPMTPGTMLALSETISGGTHKLSARALEATEVGFVPREILMGFLREHHQVCLQVVRILSEDLHCLYHTFHRLNVTNPRSRRWQPDDRIH
jgi:CRP-like cAMP-binding protein